MGDGQKWDKWSEASEAREFAKRVLCLLEVDKFGCKMRMVCPKSAGILYVILLGPYMYVHSRVANPGIRIPGSFVDPDPGIKVLGSRDRILGYFPPNL